jgi:O-antigen/teichoic acid export membrane protein
MSALPSSAPKETADLGRGASLRSKVLGGSLWSTGGYLISHLLRLASSLILTRLLFPEAFGLMALVNVIVMGFAMLSDVGLALGIVQSRRGDEPLFLDTAWSIQIGRGFVLWIAACLLASPFADFYAQPELARLLPVVALVTVFAGFQSMAVARFRRHLRLGRLTALELASQLAGITIMVTWATYQRTVWALVAGSLAGAAVRTLLSHAMSDRRDRPRWNAEAARELLHFGKWIVLSTLFAFLSTQLDRLIFGKTIPVGLLGIYSIGATLAIMPSEMLIRLGTSVVFPAFSRKLEVSDLASAYRRARVSLLAVAGLIIAPLAAAGSALIEILYDPRYAQAGWILQILAAGAWFQALEIGRGSALLALGKPQWVAAGHAAKVAGIAVLIPLGFQLGGFPGAVVGLASSQVLLYATASLGTRCQGLGGIGDDLLMTVVLAGSAASGLYVSNQLAGAGSVVQLLAGSAVSVLVWLAGVYLRLRREGKSLRSLLASLRS